MVLQGPKQTKERKNMKGSSVAVLALFLGLAVAPAMAQDAAKKDAAPKPAKGLSQAVLEQWNDVGRKLIAMAEDFPEDKYDFKPTPAQRSFAEKLQHASGVNYFLHQSRSGSKAARGRRPEA